MSVRCMHPIRQVLVYKGHEKHPLFGPYQTSIEKRIALFEKLNPLRISLGKAPWRIDAVFGEKLQEALKQTRLKETLLVIPAGESRKLDQVFQKQETAFIYQAFQKGLRGYLTCGAAYWASKKRIYKNTCEENSVIIKMSNLPLFQGTAEGPLCPYPGKEYRVGFYSDAMSVINGSKKCTVFLGGGGSFMIQGRQQKITVVARYAHQELLRIGKKETEKWSAAAIVASVGHGAALLSMFHPYYGQDDIDVDAYEKAFPGSGTDWREIKKRLSPLNERLQFVDSMLCSLEN